MTFDNYLHHIGLKTLQRQIKAVKLNTIVKHMFSQTPTPLSEEEVKYLYVYDVPKISEDGSCSIIDTPAEKPYNLAEIFKLSLSWNELRTHPQTLRLWRLRNITKEVFKLTGVNWFGIYRKAQNTNNALVLVKESYQGLFSRPEFPLTKEFAIKSNNTTVALTGKAKVIQDVSSNNGPYYKCDGKVQSEFCVPILDTKNSVTGIIDAESFPKNFFTNQRLLQIAKVAYDLGQITWDV